MFFAFKRETVGIPDGRDKDIGPRMKSGGGVGQAKGPFGGPGFCLLSAKTPTPIHPPLRPYSQCGSCILHQATSCLCTDEKRLYLSRNMWHIILGRNGVSRLQRGITWNFVN